MIFSKKAQDIFIGWLNNGMEADVEIVRASDGVEVGIDEMTTIADAAAFNLSTTAVGEWPAVSKERAKEAAAIMEEISQHYYVMVEPGNGTQVEELA